MRFAPAAATTATDDPRVVDDLVILVCQRALPIALPIWAPALRHALRQAHRRRTRGKPTISRWQRRGAEAAVRYATASLALISHAHRDQQLTALLADCLTTIRHTITTRTTHTGPLPPPAAQPLPTTTTRTS